VALVVAWYMLRPANQAAKKPHVEEQPMRQIILEAFRRFFDDGHALSEHRNKSRTIR
jgi:hypothetical protein